MSTISCSKNDETEKLEQGTSLTAERKAFITVTAQLHRGARWSEAHEVPPCSRSFGICDVHVSINFGGKNIQITDLGNNELNIKFLENVGAHQGDIFISAEDSSFTLPTDVAVSLGYNSIIILPSDYVTNFDSDNPYGNVTVNCITTK